MKNTNFGGNQWLRKAIYRVGMSSNLTPAFAKESPHGDGWRRDVVSLRAARQRRHEAGPPPTVRRHCPLWVQAAAVFIAAFTVVMTIGAHRSDVGSFLRRAGLAPGCAIKGNISEHGQIYHLPGQEMYLATRIDLPTGERWFCSEAEARAAGWRRARR